MVPRASRLAQRYRIPGEVLARRVREEMVILHLGSEEYFGLDPVGTRMWEVLQETGESTEAVERLLKEFDVEEATLSADLDRLLGELLEAGLLELEHVVEAGSGAVDAGADDAGADDAGADVPTVEQTGTASGQTR